MIMRLPSDRQQPQYPLYLYEFRYRCERTGKWRKARYRAEVEVIRERYAEFETIGEPMVIDGPAETFSSFEPLTQSPRSTSDLAAAACRITSAPVFTCPADLPCV